MLRADQGREGGHLEGKGGKEGRRHIKLSSTAEVEEKHLAEYLALAWETH